MDREPIMDSGSCYAVFDLFPVNDGHVLVIPKRHVGDYFDLTPDETREVWEMVAEVKAFLEKEYNPRGFNVGVNVGEAAGQTIDHVHIHVIPRYPGDMDDPTGGVRHVIPGKGNYLIE